MKSWACSASRRNESALPHPAPLSVDLAIPRSLPMGLSTRLAPTLTPTPGPGSRALDGELAGSQVGGHHLGIFEHRGRGPRRDHPSQVEQTSSSAIDVTR